MSRLAALGTVAGSGLATLGVKFTAMQFSIPEADLARWIVFGVGAWIGINVWHTGRATVRMEGVFDEHTASDLRTFAGYDQALVGMAADLKGVKTEVERTADRTIARVEEIVSRYEIRIEKVEEVARGAELRIERLESSRPPRSKP